MEPGLNRRTRRMAIQWQTTLLQGDTRRPCTIVDVSRSGARIRLAQPIAPRTRITLLDDRVGPIEASVVWCRGDMAGIAFQALLPDVAAKLRTVLQALEAGETRGTAERPRPQFGRRTHFGTPSK